MQHCVHSYEAYISDIQSRKELSNLFAIQQREKRRDVK